MVMASNGSSWIFPGAHPCTMMNRGGVGDTFNGHILTCAPSMRVPRVAQGYPVAYDFQSLAQHVPKVWPIEPKPQPRRSMDSW